MKKALFTLGILTIMSCQQTKIGYVNNKDLMDGYQEKTDLQNQFKTKQEALTRKRDSLSQAFQQEAQAFQAKAQTMSQTKAQEAYGQMQQKGQIMGQQLQQEELALQEEGQVQMDSLVSKVQLEIKAYGKTNGYTYILSGGNGGAVIYGNDAHNVTKEIVKRLNAAYKKETK